MVFVVIDYRKGNIRSVQKGLESVGAKTLVSENPRDIERADALVLPGVGAFADAVAFMEQSGQTQAVRAAISRGTPFLGICLGLHLLLERGEEGVASVRSRTEPGEDWAEGIGAIEGHARRLDSVAPDGTLRKVPHVGWNQVRFVPGRSEACAVLFDGIEDGSNFYFTHSYQGVTTRPEEVLAEVTHATTFPSVIGKDAVFGVQFHPEKSSHKGMKVLENFVRFARRA
jgi:glutamine amidotransferase